MKEEDKIKELEQHIKGQSILIQNLKMRIKNLDNENKILKRYYIPPIARFSSAAEKGFYYLLMLHTGEHKPGEKLTHSCNKLALAKWLSNLHTKLPISHIEERHARKIVESAIAEVDILERKYSPAVGPEFFKKKDRLKRFISMAYDLQHQKLHAWLQSSYNEHKPHLNEE